MMSHKFKFTCLKASLVAAFLLILQTGFAQGRFADLESTIDARKSMLGNDLIVVVANKDTVLYQKTFGDMNVRSQEFVGAASAWFTTTLILQLVDEGKLSLDDKIAQYIPVFGSYAKNYVTVRHCLT
ncbi:MAG: class A beta-lactamase-related serine hydrolase, partial [Gammaproteobacteria bacterium]